MFFDAHRFEDGGPQLDARVADLEGTGRIVFDHVDTWVFDLDNTLYPTHADLWPKVDARITAYLAELYGLDGISARALQKHYYQHYGTTLNGIMIEHPDVVDVADFLDFAHDIDRSNLEADSRLEAAIARLPGRRLVFTNGSRAHAEKTMAALGIAHLFEGVFDIVAGGLIPKPQIEPYRAFLKAHDVDPAHAAMFEDIARNLEVPKSLGMSTVLVVPRNGGVDHRDEVDIAHEAPPWVDQVTDDLAAFLNRVGDSLSRAKSLT